MASVPLSRRYKVSLIVLLALTSIVALLFFRILQIFLLPLFSALILVIIFQPVYHWVLTRCGNRRALAAGLTTAAVFGGVLVPFFVLASLAVAEGMAIFGQTGWGQVVGRLARLRAGIDLEMPYEALMRRADRLFLDTRTAIENGQVFSQAAAAQLTRRSSVWRTS
ncbi:MAG: hypothetical protein KatS3mg110_0270 [Pirellulaceae bacterium]|nr:MAG: hypothetical protein KatS3mg110_0270 [Pirellulaceae bacterium]